MAIPQNAIGKPSTGIKISTGWTLQLVPGSSEIFVDILALSRQLTGSKYCPTAVKVAVRCTVQR